MAPDGIFRYQAYMSFQDAHEGDERLFVSFRLGKEQRLVLAEFFEQEHRGVEAEKPREQEVTGLVVAEESCEQDVGINDEPYISARPFW